MHIKLDCYAMPGVHPQQYMRDIGIKYSHAVQQPIANCWWFFNCVGAPRRLPKPLRELKITDSSQLIGFGLSKEEADEIAKIDRYRSHNLGVRRVANEGEMGVDE